MAFSERLGHGVVLKDCRRLRLQPFPRCAFQGAIDADAAAATELSRIEDAVVKFAAYEATVQLQVSQLVLHSVPQLLIHASQECQTPQEQAAHSLRQLEVVAAAVLRRCAQREM